MAVYPQDALKLYAGTDGGIQKSGNGGATWAAIGPVDGSSGKAHRIIDIAINKQNPSIIYAVTWVGESLTNYYTNHYLVKSTDGGMSWQIKFTQKFGHRIASILIDTDDPNRLYVGVNEREIGLYLSVDGGNSWKAKRLPIPETRDQEVVALAMTPAGSKPACIYAIFPQDPYSATTAANEAPGVYASLDRGETWNDTHVPGINWNGPWALTVDPVDPATVYVGTRRWNNISKYYEGVLHKSTNAGATWLTKTLAGLATGFVFGSGSQLYAGFDNGVQRSGDGGETWQKSDRGMALTPIAGLALDPSSGKVYAAINEQSNDSLAQYNSYPLAVSSNQGSTWSFLNNGPKNLSAIAVAGGSPSKIWTGDGYKTDMNFSVQKSSDGGKSWSNINFYRITGGGEVTLGASDILVNSKDSQCVLVGFQHVIGSGILGRTLDGGYTWAKLGESTSALAADPNDPGLVYQGRAMSGGVWAISNVCGNWNTAMIASNMEIGDVNDIEVGSDSKVHVAASDGLWRWDKFKWVKLKGPPKGVPTALAIDRGSMPNRLYVGTSEEGVYSTADGGITWESLNIGLAI